MKNLLNIRFIVLSLGAFSLLYFSSFSESFKPKDKLLPSYILSHAADRLLAYKNESDSRITKSEINSLWNHYERMQLIEESIVEKTFEVKRVKKVSKKKIKTKRAVKVVSSFKTIEIKSKPIVMNTLKPKLDNEIDNSDLISHTGFKVDSNSVATTISWSNYFNKTIDNTNEKVAKKEKKIIKKIVAKQKELISDDVTVSQAAPNRNDPTDTSGFLNDEEMLLQDTLVSLEEAAKKRELVKESKPKTETPNNDDLVFIDYSDELNKEQASNVKTRLDLLNDVSSRVQKSINREMAAGPIGPKVTVKNSDNKVNTQLLGQSYSINKGLHALSTQKNNKNQASPLTTQDYLRAAVKRKSFNPRDRVTRTTLNVLEAKISKGLSDPVRNLTFVPAYNPNKHISDKNGDGRIHIVEKMNGQNSILRGSIKKPGFMDTKVDIVLEEGSFIIDIPLLEEEYFYRFKDKEELEGYGSHLLIGLDDNVDSVDVEVEQYEAKILLNSKLKPVSEVDDYSYVLYLGLPAGNVLLRYLTLKGQVAQKIIHLVEGEVYFEASSFDSSKVEDFLLFERNIMGKSKSELDLDELDILYYNTNIHPQKQALNRYEIRRPLMTEGSRRYFEFKHLGESIYFGAGKTKNFEIPSREFIQTAMGRNRLESLEGSCMIQLNFSNRISNLSAEGETIKGPMSLEVSFLDKDGVMNYEATELASNAFLIGDLQGIINVKVEYEDNSIDYLQTYCSPRTYLVEQL